MTERRSAVEKPETPDQSDQPAPELYSVLDKSIGFLITDTARLGRRVLYARLASHGVRGGSWFILRALWENEGPTQRELSSRMGTTQSSTLEMLRTMEGEGLVRFERDTVDRRKLRIYLTEQARALKAPLTEVANDANRVMLERVSQAEAMLFKIILQTIRATLTDEIGRITREGVADDPPAALNLQDEVAPAVPKRKRAAQSS